jgi:hypothetical protein
MPIFIPPPVRRIPAALTRFVQLLASVIGLPAVTAMVLNGFVQFVIRFRDTALAIVICVQSWRAGEEQESRQRRTGQRYFSRTKNSGLKFCLHPVLL